MASPQIIGRKLQSVDYVTDAFKAAQYASIVISVDKGTPNKIVAIVGGYEVVTDDQRVFQFIQK